jgi:hypothetical protein
MTAGTTSVCTMLSRPMMTSPGNSPLKIEFASQLPTTGMDRMTPEAIRRLVPDGASSGSV